MRLADGQKLDDEGLPDSISTVISSPDFKPLEKSGAVAKR